MTVPINAVKKQIVCDGQTRTWQFDYPILEEETIEVWVKPPQGTCYRATDHVVIDRESDEDYTYVTYPALSSGLEPLARGYQIVLRRSTPLTQNIVFGSSVLPKTFSEAFDKTVLQVQNLDEKISRCVRYQPDPALGESDTQADTFLGNVISQANQTIQTAAASVTQSLADHDNSATSHAAIRQNFNQAVTTLQTALFNEQTARSGADDSLQTSLTGLTGALTDETSARQQADATLQTQLASQGDAIGVVQSTLNSKQNALTAAQLSAVNSGVTSTTVEQVSAQQENISAIMQALESQQPWQPHSQWPDIRSSANWNSAIFLVGHKADYSKYPSFTMKAQVSNSGTYDVFVDGIKQATTASGTATTLTWQTLSLTSGYDVTYPEALRTHIVRIAPSLGTNTITRLEGNVSDQGTLWAHITATNAIHYEYTFKNNAALEAVTTPTGELLVDWYPGIFQNCTSLKINPVINCTTSGNYYDTYAFRNTRVKKITIKNATINYSTDAFRENPNLEEIELINSKMQFDDRSFNSCPKLKNIPQIWLVGNHNLNFNNPGLTGLENTFLDFSLDTGRVNKIDVSGTSTNRVDGLKGLVVSPSSPLADSNGPQINVSYTGLDRGALVNLFNSMPTVTNNQVCNITGATGAADLTADDLAIATGKGWTVTR